ncbi:MAG: hypothetical protein FJ117_14525 [Deltaproteobacteria bacterium]|nr:hypothetical protein [Deltaproteobacteria bacterium]
MKKEKQKTKKWADYYDQTDLLNQITEEPVEVSLDDQVLREILSRSRKRKLQNVTIKMDPLQVKMVRKLATMKSIPYQTLVRHWLSENIRKELGLVEG